MGATQCARVSVCPVMCSMKDSTRAEEEGGREGCILVVSEDLSVESVAKIYLRVRGREAENGDTSFRQKPESVWWA